MKRRAAKMGLWLNRRPQSSPPSLLSGEPSNNSLPLAVLNRGISQFFNHVRPMIGTRNLTIQGMRRRCANQYLERSANEPAIRADIQ